MKPLIDKLAWLEIQEGKILVAKSKGKSAYFIPGGKREPNESDAEALIREIKEELSVDIEPQSLRFYGEFTAQAYGHEEGVLVKMTCYSAKYEGSILADSEIESIQWLNYHDHAQVSFVDKIIFDDLKAKGILV